MVFLMLYASKYDLLQDPLEDTVIILNLTKL